MAKIIVEFSYTTHISYEVEADSPTEARIKANKKYNETNEMTRAEEFYDNLVYDETRFYNEVGEEIFEG